MVVELLALDRLDDLLGYIDSKCLLREMHAISQLQLVVSVGQPLDVVPELIREESKVTRRMMSW